MSVPRIIALCIATASLALLAFLQPLRFLNNLFYDLSSRFSNAAAADSVAVVAIDEQSIEKIGAMPWSRGTLASLVDKINAAGARAVTMDMLFPLRPGKEQNDSLAAAFSRTPALVLPFKAERLSTGTAAAAGTVAADVFRYRFMRLLDQDKLSSGPFYSAGAMAASDSQFTRHAKYGGFLNVSTSATSQKLREAVHVIRSGDEYYPSLGIASVAAFRGLGPSDMTLSGADVVTLGNLDMPLTSYAGTLFINFRKSGFVTVPAASLLDNTADASLLRGRLVFVGVTDPAAGADFFLTPIGPQYPGVMVWATVALDIMQKAWVSRGSVPGAAANAALLLLLFPGCALLIPSYRRLLSIGAASAILAASVALCIALFRSHHYFWDPTGHVYAWIMMLLWLAAQRAVPALAADMPINLEPAESIDETVPRPPQEQDFKAALPETATVRFVLKTVPPSDSGTSAQSQPARVPMEYTLDETATPDQPSAQPLRVTAGAPAAEKIREIAGSVIVRCLGSGGMADVYLAWNPRLEAYRAFKVIKPGQSKNILDRFETEIRIFAKLQHPNIVQCHGVGEWHSLPYIEMEYINGASMDRVLQRCGKFSVEQALGVGVLVCRALHYAHNQNIQIFGKTYKGVVHRDLKPANIMLCRNGRVKLTDFGIARPGDVSLNTQDSGNLVGTLPYLAPEQVAGAELTGQVDIYALGATIYEFLSGEMAFPQTTIPSIINAKTTNAYKPLAPSGLLTKEIIAIIDRSMAANPKERYPTALAFRNDLEKALRPLCRPDGFSHIRELAEKGLKKSSTIA